MDGILHHLETMGNSQSIVCIDRGLITLGFVNGGAGFRISSIHSMNFCAAICPVKTNSQPAEVLASKAQVAYLA